MLPNYQARSPFVLKHTTSIYVCMDGTYAPTHTLLVQVFLTRLFRLDPTFFWYYSINQVLLSLQIVLKFLRKRLFFMSPKVAATGYYGIENPLPYVNKNFLNSPFFELLSAAC